MPTPYYAYPTPIYQPAMRIVQSITIAIVPEVTTTFAHLYKTGTVVRIDMPEGFGMQQINQKFGTIVVTGSTTFLINIDTTFFDTMLAFIDWPADASSYPQCLAIGEDNSILTAAVQNVS